MWPKGDRAGANFCFGTRDEQKDLLYKVLLRAEFKKRRKKKRQSTENLPITMPLLYNTSSYTIQKPPLVIFGQVLIPSSFWIFFSCMRFFACICVVPYIIYLFEGFLCVMFWVNIQTLITKLCRGHMRRPIGCMTPLLLVSACYLFIYTWLLHNWKV